MSDLKLQKKEIKGENGDTIQLVYDKNEDILEIFFGENEPATGVELTDHILLRLNPKTGRAISLTLLHFAILIERTEYGPRSYPIAKFEELPEELRDTALRTMTKTPVSRFLKILSFQESPNKSVPLTYVEPYSFTHAAHHAARGPSS